MVEAIKTKVIEIIKTKVIEIDFDEIDIKQIITIHPDAKYVIVCGETDSREIGRVGRSIDAWYSDPDSPFAILMGDFMLVRIDKLPSHVADSLGISV